MEAGAIAVRRVRKEDLRHVAKATGATAVYSQWFFRSGLFVVYMLALAGRASSLHLECYFVLVPENIWSPVIS